MKIKVIPVHLELDLKSPESPLKVQYVVELTTGVFNDVMSTGVTYLANPEVAKAIEHLVDAITNGINVDLGLQTQVETEETDALHAEEEL